MWLRSVMLNRRYGYSCLYRATPRSAPRSDRRGAVAGWFKIQVAMQHVMHTALPGRLDVDFTVEVGLMRECKNQHNQEA